MAPISIIVFHDTEGRAASLSQADFLICSTGHCCILSCKY